jgi:hypothetical protein
LVLSNVIDEALTFICDLPDSIIRQTGFNADGIQDSANYVADNIGQVGDIVVTMQKVGGGG